MHKLYYHYFIFLHKCIILICFIDIIFNQLTVCLSLYLVWTISLYIVFKFILSCSIPHFCNIQTLLSHILQVSIISILAIGCSIQLHPSSWQHTQRATSHSWSLLFLLFFLLNILLAWIPLFYIFLHTYFVLFNQAVLFNVFLYFFLFFTL